MSSVYLVAPHKCRSGRSRLTAQWLSSVHPFEPARRYSQEVRPSDGSISVDSGISMKRRKEGAATALRHTADVELDPTPEVLMAPVVLAAASRGSRMFRVP